jgi:hypothetical protein
MNTSQIMSVMQAADFLRMAHKALLHHVRKGHIKSTRLGRDYVLLRPDVEEFRNKRAGGEYTV